MKRFLTLLLVACIGWPVLATHNRAGEITYKYLSGRTYEVTITTYTKESVAADRCELELHWGDNSSSFLSRQNGPAGPCPNALMGEVIKNDVKKNVYKGTHTYGSDGAYTVFFEDPNRNGGIINIDNSVNVPFYVQSEFVVDAGIGPNSSPVLTYPPIDDGCINRRYEHNPGAVDSDGDSLSYELVPCRYSSTNIITTTYDPTKVKDSVKIDSRTGDLYWDVPQKAGEFNFAVEISEWRKKGNGWVRIGYVTRDMQVTIGTCTNRPPIIQPVGPFCVEAGTTLNFNITATDPDGDNVTLSAFGSPFELSLNPADPFQEESGPVPVIGTFNWNTACNHVRDQPFFVTFRAEDHPPANEKPLVDLFTTEITVVAPAPKKDTALGGIKSITLLWNESFCKQAIGYDIYRREDRYGFAPSECETGVPAYTGYQFLDSIIGLNSISYIDSIDLQRGVNYCYMVVARFPLGVESYASKEFCTAIKLSAPLLTNVDVLSTDVNNGEIDVKWIFPPEVDSANFPPPYSYKLYRTDEIDGDNFVEIASLPSANDTFYTDSGLNTEDLGYNYAVEMLYGTNNEVLGISDPASSVYLEVTGSDESNILKATHYTPWKNTQYIIYRDTVPGSNNFDSLDVSFSPTYIDRGLENGREYCYKVQTIGGYTMDSLLHLELVNNSQIQCGSAIDTTKPCPPELITSYVCEKDSIHFELINPNDSFCAQDVIGFNIYYKKLAEDPWPEDPIVTITNSNSISLVGESITGCWAATSFDDAASDPGGSTNESNLSEVLCIESCPDIQLPNVFTPNGDGQNDNFLPISLNDIKDLSIKVYNRWGVLVFESNSLEEFANEGWDGKDMNSGNPCSDGVYFYVVNFTPQNYQSQVSQEINGFVHLFGNSD